MTDKKYYYSLTVVPGQWVQFSDLPHMMAIAMHPDGEMAYGATRLNLENELTQAVSDGLLTVRNRYGLGIHTFPHGDALQQAVLIPDDLEPFLNARGIELRITPHGNGPDYQTPENTAATKQEQLNSHDGTCADFQDQVQEVAPTGPKLSINKAALVAQHKHEWPTIEGDLKGASENGLSKAAKAGTRDWNEDAAMKWARSRNRLIQPASTTTSTSVMSNLPGKIHLMKG